MIPMLERIAEKSRDNPDMVFTSIGHLINVEMLKQCFRMLDGKKAVGIDGVTKEDYGQHLEENLEDLVRRLKEHRYVPKPAKRVCIPKDNGKMRPLAIYSFEDKLMQQALKEMLEAVFEPHFHEETCGFRPGRGCHTAIKRLDSILMGKTSYVLDSDIKGFFDHLDHKWIIKFVESRIKDPNIIRLVRVMLNAGVMDDGAFIPTDEGSGQGSVCSPILANIYMHYVLVYWHRECIAKYLRGESGLVTYADDFVVCFQYKSDAEVYYEHLKRRMGRFGLTLEESKTRLIEFGRFAAENNRKRGKGEPETFTFLGFTHYCSTSRNGKFRVKRKTSQKKFRKKLKEIRQELKRMYDWKPEAIIDKLNRTLRGYDQYYSITDNIFSVGRFHNEVMKSLFWMLNRRSQRKSYTWDSFNELLKYHPLLPAKIRVSLY